jgi:aquaporin Z
MTARRHWTEYGIEAAGLGLFMVSALGFTTLFQHPASPVPALLPDETARRALTGIAMGLTAASITYSKWGQRSGAHLNPSVTLGFLRLGKVARRDALHYVLAQFAGGALGVLLVASIVRAVVADPSVNYVATLPGPWGAAAAFAAELAISFGMMTLVLLVSNTPRVAHLTGAAAACLIALYITFEAPLSGMSMNPARSFGPAVARGDLGALWIYFSAPPLGMFLAAEAYVRVFGRSAVRCAKLHHPKSGYCIFGCMDVRS